MLSTWPDVTQVFGTIHLNPHSSINRHNNFRTFPQSLTLLFRYTRASNSLDTLAYCFTPSGVLVENFSVTYVHRLPVINHPTLKFHWNYRPVLRRADFVLCNLSDFDKQAKSFLYICNWEKSPRTMPSPSFHDSFSWHAWCSFVRLGFDFTCLVLQLTSRFV